MAEPQRAVDSRFAGIMWVGKPITSPGSTANSRNSKKKVDSNAAASKVWMVHSGGFYSVEKQKSLAVAPEQVRWFRWGSVDDVGGRRDSSRPGVLPRRWD